MTNYLAAKLSRRLVQRSPAMRDEDGSAAKPDQFWGTSNPLMYRFVSKVRTDPFLLGTVTHHPGLFVTYHSGSYLRANSIARWQSTATENPPAAI